MAAHGPRLHPRELHRRASRRVSKASKARVAEADVPEIRLHDPRHTWASLALAAGVHPKVVSERLGHATVSMTLDVYSHAIPALQAEAADTVAGLIFHDDDDEDRDGM